ncbi:Putative ribonuclease H protein At1g65750 [Linum perenne]
MGSYNLEDKLIWHFNKDGRYTVRSAYRVYMERVLNKSHLHVGGDWTSLWAFRAQPKIKHFAWRLGRGVLPTRTALRERRIGVPVACGLCEGPPETLWHLFFECDTARRCWQHLGKLQFIDASIQGVTSFKDWMLQIINTSPEKVVQEALVVLWSLWKERNARVWDNKKLRPAWILKPGLEELADWLRAREKRNVVQQPMVQRCDRWHPPPRGELKCNVDGATFQAEGRSGMGAVIRDERGGLIKVRMRSWPGVWRSREVEAQALLEAMSWGESEGWTGMVFESDAQEVVRAIQTSRRDDTEFGDILGACDALLRRNPGFSIAFVRRGQNKIAHELARHSASYFLPFFSDDAPIWLTDISSDCCMVAHD